MTARVRPVRDRSRPWAGAVPAGQVARQAWATRGPLALALAVVALVTFLASSAPRVLDRAATDEVRAAAGATDSRLAVTVRDTSDVHEVRLGTADQLSSTAELLAGNLPPRSRRSSPTRSPRSSARSCEPGRSGGRRCCSGSPISAATEPVVSRRTTSPTPPSAP